MGGGTKSGTPLETRGASRAAGGMIQDLFSQPGGFEGVLSSIASPMQRLGSESAMNILGFDPRQVGLGAAVRRGLTDPSDATAGLFGALEPLERRTASEGLGGLMTQLGGAGGRFGGSAMEGGGSFLADFGAQRLAGREQALLQQQGLQNQLLSQLIPGLNQSASIGMGATSDILGQLLGFAAPGAPVHQQGWGGPLAGGLLGTLGGSFLGPIGAAGGQAVGQRLFG